ncbi:DUF479 domain-containing protein [Flammeovirga yaeyamensis]|uniref:DUF479 domain-containing protein n=1 Tax=Flammeovirga yaeyamensis TaxID=367791 RepID=A0AAX1NC08_9BACT|nr:ACP phosphodiesterase [Flammeovirga yaeyamensis]MBB3698984.1 acyl carrier protein phosphodiesterase [Flammeovirga yaeyamensis]NMF36418.1 DUF479 domain-containing protein [Flammeovirga yaeyamensis]QWG03622.1 DUF479 domain-containing protein [Flammeovirga yaeyamensis]
MNYLAHLYLSRDDHEEMFGNFLGDFVKGKNLSHLPQKVGKGVQLHRLIDEYTDNHEVTKEIQNHLKPVAGRYSLIVVDIYYDHFLAKHWNEFEPHLALSTFADNFYTHNYWKEDWVPQKALDIYPFMKDYDWLNVYAKMYGMQRVFNGMQRRIKNRVELSNAVQWLEKDYEFYQSQFFKFFPDLVTFSQQHRL